MDKNGSDGPPEYIWSGGGEDRTDTLDGADDRVSVRDGDAARSKSGGGSV